MFFIFPWKWLPFLFLYKPILHGRQLGDYFPNQVARSKILGSTATKMVATWRVAFDYLHCTVFFFTIICYIQVLKVDRRIILSLNPFFDIKRFRASKWVFTSEQFGPYSKLRTANWPIAWRKQTQPYNKKAYRLSEG